MGFIRFSVAPLALLVGLIFVTPLQAQIKNAEHADDVKRAGRILKPTGISGAVPAVANYQVSQTTGAITPGITAVTGFNCGISPQGDDCMATVTIPQPLGGGLNSSLAVGVISVAQPLAPGANVNVEFRLGVQAGGAFRFFVNVEALP